MDRNVFNVYWIDMKYIRNLSNNVDKRVYSVSPQSGKQERPFLGVIIMCNQHKYCVPLSKPKEKHKSMRDRKTVEKRTTHPHLKVACVYDTIHKLYLWIDFIRRFDQHEARNRRRGVKICLSMKMR